MQYIRPVKTKAECAIFFQQNLAFYNKHPHLGRWAIIEKNTEEFIGSFAIIPIEEESRNIQIGYALKPAAWGKGFATELVNYGKRFFFSMHKADALYALTDQENVASQHVLIKSGFKKDGILIAGERSLCKFILPRKIFLENPLKGISAAT
jgi:ribosomal-protein-alanine N-acetyltransferase